MLTCDKDVFKNESESSAANGNRHRELQKCFSRCLFLYIEIPHIRFIIYYRLQYKYKEAIAMKAKRKYFYLDDFEHRLLVRCLMTTRNEYIHAGKPTEDVNELILKIIDAPKKKLRVIVKEDA